MATRDSNRAPPHAAAAFPASKRTSRRTPKTKGNTADRPNLDAVLGQFAEALALVETAHSALDVAQEAAGVGRAIGGAVLTIERGLAELRRTYIALDLAILRLR